MLDPSISNVPSSGTSRETLCEFVAALMWGPKSKVDLQQIIGASPTTIENCIMAARRSGIIRVSRIRSGKPGNPMRIYELQSKPFEREDDK